MNRLLARGDVFRLEKGTKVYHNIPVRFIFSNASSFTETAETEVSVGEVRKLAVEKKNFSTRQSCGCRSCPQHTKFPFDEDETYDTSYLLGDYEVVWAQLDGAGYGHGYHDYYPPGWIVYAEKVYNPSIAIRFYQSGAFTAVVEPKEVQLVNGAKK